MQTTKTILCAGICILLISNLSRLQAQTNSRTEKFYVQAGTGWGSHSAAISEFSVHTVLKKNWTVGLSYQGITADPKNLPGDYVPAYDIIFLFPISEGIPSVKLNLFSLTAGKILKTGKKTWFSAEGGLSLVSGEQMTFTPRPIVESDPLMLLFLSYSSSSNYDTHTEKKTSVGGVMKADFNWAIRPFMGISVGGFTNLNSIQSTSGIEFKIILGKLYKRK